MADTADAIVSASFDNCCALCCVFLLVTFLNLIKMYDLPAGDPQMVFGYISVIHLIALPIFYFHFLKQRRIIFLFLNLVWILLMATAVLVYSLMKSDTSSISNWKSNPLSHVLLTVYLTCGILLEIFTFIAHGHKIRSRYVSSTTSSITRTSDQPNGSQVVVPVQQVTSGSVPTSQPKQTYQLVTAARSPPPRPPPPANVTYLQPDQVILTPTPPVRHHRKKKHDQAIVSPVLSTASGSLVAVPGVQIASDPSV